MSILIKGMEMPKDRGVYIAIDIDGQAYTKPVGALNWKNLKQKAVPVPPHGRLGDLDALVERIEGIWDCNDMVFKPDDHICDVPADCKGCKWAQTVDCIKRMVENAPTIIPAEEGE